MLEREEYVEQAYLFRMLGERLPENEPLQDLLGQLRHELLATTRLPMAVDFILTELRHSGLMSAAMRRLPHYFTPFQTYVVAESESEHGRFDSRVAIDILHYEAKYLAESPRPQGLFMFQFEVISRNRLRYDRGLDAMADDPLYGAEWREWIHIVRRQLGLVDLADMIYVRSEEYLRRKVPPGEPPAPPEAPVLFGEKEGRIAWANRQKDPMYLFASLQRHLNYPMAPRIQKIDESKTIVPQLVRRMERLEVRMKLLEEENREGIDITRFYSKDAAPGPAGE